MFGIGPPELIIIFLIVLLLFGGRKIPEIAKGLGRGMREFRKAKDDIRETIEDEEEEEKGQKEENKDSAKKKTTDDDIEDSQKDDIEFSKQNPSEEDTKK